jgi:GrpB-like predicted nucleotidyltransferase (UPF0157 family)
MSSQLPLGLRRGTVHLVASDARWPGLFRAEADRIAHAASAAGLPALALEHVGSTAVPGLCAKPILDLLAGYPAGAGPGPYVDALTGAGYEPRGDQGEAGGVLLVLGAEAARTHYVHLVALGDPTWRSSLAFRDRLRAEPALAAAYAALKRELAERYAADRAAYTAGKAAFIRAALAGVPVVRLAVSGPADG